MQHRIEEANLVGKTTVEHCLAKLEEGYNARSMGAYVDSLESPSCCLIMAHFPGVVMMGTSAFILFAYASPEKRGTPGLFESIVSTAENYAKLNGASSVFGSSWLYKGCRGIDSLWKASGYEIQESVYVKHLDDK